MKFVDILSGVGLCAFSLLMLFVIIPWQIEPAPSGYLSPRLIPQLMMGAVAVLAVLQVFNALRRQNADQGFPIKKSEILALIKIGGVFASAIILYFMETPLGASIVLIAGTMVVLGERRVWLIVSMTGGLIFTAWYLFYQILNTAIL